MEEKPSPRRYCPYQNCGTELLVEDPTRCDLQVSPGGHRESGEKVWVEPMDSKQHSVFFISVNSYVKSQY